MKLFGLSIQPVQFAGRLPSSRQTHRHRNIEEQGEMWQQTAGGCVIGSLQPGKRKTTAEALIGERGIRKTITEDNRASSKSRPDEVSDMLAPGRKNKKCLGFRRYRFRG